MTKYYQQLAQQQQNPSGTMQWTTPTGVQQTVRTTAGTTAGTTGALTGAMQQFSPQNMMQQLLNFRPQFIQQQQNLLNQYGSSLRQSILGASPELSQAANFYQSRFQNPIPPELEAQFQERIRGAQAARGFGGGGTGPVGEEARYLTGLAEEQRLKLLPQMEQFGAGILGMSGLAQPTQFTGDNGLNAFANMFSSALRNQQFNQQLAFEQQGYQDSLAASQQQSQFAQQYYNWLKQQIGSGYGDTQSSPWGSYNYGADRNRPVMNYGFA